jgi:DNA-binding response OmpR family regulator
VQELIAHRHDVLITDWLMPNLDGLALLREAQRLHPTMPVILMTGALDAGFGLQALATGAFDVIPKVLERDEFVRVVRAAVTLNRLCLRTENERRLLARLRRRLSTFKQCGRAEEKAAPHAESVRASTDPESSRTGIGESLALSGLSLQRLAYRVKLADHAVHIASERFLRVQLEAKQRALKRLHLMLGRRLA